MKVVAYDPKQNFLKRRKTIVYHGREGLTRAGRSNVVYQYILEDDLDKSIYTDIFSIDDGVFLGWTRNKDNLDSPDYFGLNGSMLINYSSLESNVMHLYAVWNRYAFGLDDTTIILNANANETYTISRITIDPNITFENGNRPLENKVIIDFDSK